MAIKRGEELFANYRWAQNESDNNAFNVSQHQDKGWVLHFKGKAAGENNLAAFINSCINPDTGRESLVSGEPVQQNVEIKITTPAQLEYLFEEPAAKPEECIAIGLFAAPQSLDDEFTLMPTDAEFTLMSTEDTPQDELGYTRQKIEIESRLDNAI